MNAEIVPFGKYKGQPVEILAADTDYCEWLTTQPWFRQRYGNVYNTIINYGGEPQDSPEHNEMQARFLDDDWCFRLCGLLRPDEAAYRPEAAEAQLAKNRLPAILGPEIIKLTRYSAAITDRRFEHQGWDVVFAVEPPAVDIELKCAPQCICGSCDHTDCALLSQCKSSEGPVRNWCKHEYHEKHRANCHSDGRHRDPDSWSASDHCNEKCPWSKSVFVEALQKASHGVSCYPDPRGPDSGEIQVECKPDLGDDYPAVLRQVLHYPYEWRDSRCVLVRRHAFEKVTWEQVVRIFNGSNIRLLHESALTA